MEKKQTISTVNNRAYAEKLAETFRQRGAKAEVKPAPVSNWGGGGSTPGYHIEVTEKVRKHIIQ